MLAQSSKPALSIRQALLTMCNFVIYNKDGINKLMFDVNLQSTGSEVIEMGNSSVWIKFHSNCLNNFKFKANPRFASGGYGEPLLQVVGNKYIGLQFFCESGGQMISTEAEKLLTIYADIADMNSVKLDWDRVNTAIVDKFIPHRVITDCIGGYSYPKLTKS